MPDMEYGTLGGISSLAHQVNTLREENKGHSVLIDAGDWAQGTLESHLDRGKTMLQVMKAIGYDAVEIGNHEFDWGRRHLNNLIKDSGVPFIGANIIKEDDSLLNEVKPYILKELDGLKVGIIGVLTDAMEEEGDPRKVAGLTFAGVIDTTRKYADELRAKGADIVIVTTHQSDEHDRELAQGVNDIVIVGGHSHKQLMEKVNGNIIVKSGTQGRQVGHLQLLLDGSDHRMLECRNSFIPITPDIEPDPAVEQVISAEVIKADRRKSRVVGEVSFDMPHDRLKMEESVFGDFVVDAMRIGTGSDIAMKVSSGVRDRLFAGKITFGDVYRALPGDYAAVSMDLTGAQIKKLMENSAVQNKNYMQVSGMNMDIDYARPPGDRVTTISLDYKPLDPQKTYRVTVDEISTTGSCGYNEFLKGKNIIYHRSQRDLVLDYLQYKDYHMKGPRHILPVNLPPYSGRIIMHNKEKFFGDVNPDGGA
jgi:2',3'-cyclic-nucleotide 2'-phosphodiesterase (5'-nucleotidase family)